MPKIIENLRDRLLVEARRQVEESGYSATTVRSVARACGIGVGTVYNYFPSKDALLAGYMLQDWRVCMEKIRAVSEASAEPLPVLRCIYDQLREFSAQHAALFRDEAAKSGFAGGVGTYHGLLRRQLAEPLERYCDVPFTAEFAAEALLTWSTAGKEFEEIGSLIQKLF